MRVNMATICRGNTSIMANTWKAKGESGRTKKVIPSKNKQKIKGKQLKTGRKSKILNN